MQCLCYAVGNGELSTKKEILILILESLSMISCHMRRSSMYNVNVRLCTCPRHLSTYFNSLRNNPLVLNFSLKKERERV